VQVDAAEYAPDGSPVALYATLAPLGEPQIIQDAVPAGAEVLELGAGAGRVTHELVALGHPVTAVDQSPAMLDLIRGAETVLADIDELSLERRFPVVVLASNFVNDPDRTRVRSYLDCCARHAFPSGQVLVQGYPRDWRPDSEWREVGGVRLRLRSFELDGPALHGEMEYVVGGERLCHEFEALLVGEAQLDAELDAAGLRRRRYLDDARSWIEAIPL
jgi:SAM-dependent methyltransferase